MDDQVQDFTVTLAMAHLRGVQTERERFLALLQKEQERTKLGFIQYQRIRELLEEN